VKETIQIFIGNTTTTNTLSPGIEDIYFELINYFANKNIESSDFYDLATIDPEKPVAVIEDFFSLPYKFNCLLTLKTPVLYLVLTEFSNHRLYAFNVGPLNERVANRILNFFLFESRVKLWASHIKKGKALYFGIDLLLLLVTTLSINRSAEILTLKSRYILVRWLLEHGSADSMVLLASSFDVAHSWSISRPVQYPLVNDVLEFKVSTETEFDDNQKTVIFTSGKQTAHRLKYWSLLIQSLAQRYNHDFTLVSEHKALCIKNVHYFRKDVYIVLHPLANDAVLYNLVRSFNLVDLYVPQYSWWKYESPARRKRSLSKHFLFISLLGVSASSITLDYLKHKMQLAKCD